MVTWHVRVGLVITAFFIALHPSTVTAEGKAEKYSDFTRELELHESNDGFLVQPIPLSEVDYTSTVRLSIILRNDTDQEIKLREVRASCACTSLRFPATTIPPQERCIGTVVFPASQFAFGRGIDFDLICEGPVKRLTGSVSGKLINFASFRHSNINIAITEGDDAKNTEVKVPLAKSDDVDVSDLLVELPSDIGIEQQTIKTVDGELTLLLKVNPKAVARMQSDMFLINKKSGHRVGCAIYFLKEERIKILPKVVVLTQRDGSPNVRIGSAILKVTLEPKASDNSPVEEDFQFTLANSAHVRILQSKKISREVYRLEFEVSSSDIAQIGSGQLIVDTGQFVEQVGVDFLVR